MGACFHLAGAVADGITVAARFDEPDTALLKIAGDAALLSAVIWNGRFCEIGLMADTIAACLAWRQEARVAERPAESCMSLMIAKIE